MANSSTQNDQISMLGLYEEDINRFGKILRTMNLDNIPDFASAVRQHGHRSTGHNPPEGLSAPCSISCKVIRPPICGSYHIVFPIEFADGVKWMLKISANGDHFDSLAAAALASEAQTMQMLKRETSIPVPVVYAFDTSSDNALVSPYILMEKLGGRPLSHLWFDSEVPKARLEHFRMKALQSLAGAMVQLNTFTLNTGGSLVFDSDGKPVGLCGAKVVDGVATFNKAFACRTHQYDCNEGCENTSDEFRVEAATSNTPNASGCNQANTNMHDDDDIICERGPFSYPKAYFMSNLDRSDPAFRDDAYERGTDMSLRLFIEWAFADSRDHDRRFVLTHPDLDVQNILVAEDGILTGLIDWDGVAAVPREVGCSQYPLWLMRDWVPCRYQYDTEKGKPCADIGYEESSPAELASYRASYAQLMEVEIEKMTGGSNKLTTFGTSPKHEAELTRRSLIMRSLDLAAGDPWVALDTVNHLIDQIEELTAPEWEDSDSDTDSLTSCSSVSDTDNTIDSDSDSEEIDEEAEAPEINEQGWSGTRGNASTHQTDHQFGGTERIVPEASVQVDHSSCGVAKQNQVSPASPEACQVQFEESETPKSSIMDRQGDSSTAPAPMGWTRRLLRFGCKTAEKSLRRIAKVGYVLEDAVDEVAEVLAEVEGQYANTLAEERDGLVMDSKTPQQMTAINLSEHIGTEHFKFIPSTQDTVGPAQLKDVRRTEPTAELQEISSFQTADESEQAKMIATPERQDIPMRKAELLEAVKMEKKAERKAHMRRDKAAIKEELKVWEHIALAVWSRGTSLKQLRKNQFKIARWVVDTLRAAQELEDGLTAKLEVPSTAEENTLVAEIVDGSAAAPSLREGNSMPSKEKPEEARLEEDVLQTMEFKGDEPQGTSEVTVANVEGNNEPESKILRSSLKKPIITTQDVSAPEKSTFDIFKDNKDDPESLTTNFSLTQPEARLCLARSSRASKSKGGHSINRRKKNSPAAEAGRTLRVLGNENPSSSALSADTALPNNSAPRKQTELSFDEDELASGSNLERKNMMRNEEAARNITKVKEVQPPSGPSPESGDRVPPAQAKASYNLRALCKSGASYISQFFFSHNQSKEGSVCSSPESSVLSDNGEEEGGGGSDVGDAHSSATSLSDAEDEDRENGKCKEDKDDTPEVIVIAAGEGSEGEEGGDEGDEESDEDGREEGRVNEVKGETSRHSHATFTKGSFKEDRPIHSHAPRRIYEPCSGDWVEANKVDATIKTGSTVATDDEAQVGEAIGTADGNVGGDTDNEDDQENRAGEEQIVDGELPEFEDHGGFDRYTVCNLLGMGELDELRLLRLKDGFLKLLEQY